MDGTLNLITAQFELHNRLFKNVVEGLENNKSAQLNEYTNHAAWLAGHIVSSRYALTNVLGAGVTEPHPGLFEHGKGINPAAEYPGLDTCAKDFDEITPKLEEKLKSLTAEQLNAEGPFKVPMGQRMDQIIAFFAHHEAYHIGQLGILRKYFGKEAMKYS